MQNKINNVFLVIVLIVVGISMSLVALKFDEQDKKIDKQDKKIDKLTKIVGLQIKTSDINCLVPVIESIVNVLSNQTKSIKALESILDIQIMSTGDCSLPTVKEMKSSTNKVIDLRGIDLLVEAEQFYKAFRDHPWQMTAGLLH